MTAEIAVLNEEGVALAADSAVTGPKIFTSANKIFALSKYHPVGVMVFDSAQFLNVPWETIIKQYRRELGRKVFPTLAEHAEDFVKFFRGRNKLFPAEAQELATELLARQVCRGILGKALRRLKVRLDSGEDVSEDDVNEVIKGLVEKLHREWMQPDRLPSLPANHGRTIRESYRDAITRAITEIFQKASLAPATRRKIRDIIVAVLTKDENYRDAPFHSGIVVAGFGKNDVYPSLRSFSFESIAKNRLKYTQAEPVEIGLGNRAAIVPFAQVEEVFTFMEGVDPRVRAHQIMWWATKLPKLARDAGEHAGLEDSKLNDFVRHFQSEWIDMLVDEYADELKTHLWRKYAAPIIKIVAMLPKDELASMAESLVNLTSFKRRVKDEAETVGGPIDVAVISRGDGFIWIKRKHYFSTELNPQFLANYYLEDQTDG